MLQVIGVPFSGLFLKSCNFRKPLRLFLNSKDQLGMFIRKEDVVSVKDVGHSNITRCVLGEARSSFDRHQLFRRPGNMLGFWFLGLRHENPGLDINHRCNPVFALHTEIMSLFRITAMRDRHEVVINERDYITITVAYSQPSLSRNARARGTRIAQFWQSARHRIELITDPVLILFTPSILSLGRPLPRYWRLRKVC